MSKICLKKFLLSECTQFIALKSYSSYLHGEVRGFRFGESASNAKSGYTSSLTLNSNRVGLEIRATMRR
ncbi:hypothetical protein [Microcystis aeruginosa]|uniref:hypothetical protein n=1 Tax=Microcystis aeruginosa TaxID=1126 RepID=UPI0021BFB6E8|nr:hypothetical protein [Microcystis aeruginosa]